MSIPAFTQINVTTAPLGFVVKESGDSHGFTVSLELDSEQKSATATIRFENPELASHNKSIALPFVGSEALRKDDLSVSEPLSAKRRILNFGKVYQVEICLLTNSMFVSLWLMDGDVPVPYDFAEPAYKIASKEPV